MGKDDAISIINNSNLSEKRGLLKIYLYIKKWMNPVPLKQLIIKQQNKDAILGRAKKHSENNKKVLKDKARNKQRL